MRFLIKKDFKKISSYEKKKILKAQNLYEIDNPNKLYSLCYSNIKTGLDLEQAINVIKEYQKNY